MFKLFKKKEKVIDNRDYLDPYDVKRKILDLKRMSYKDLVDNYRNPEDVKHHLKLIKEPTVSLIKLIHSRGITYTEAVERVYKVKVKETDIVIDFMSSKWFDKDDLDVNIFEGIKLNRSEVSCIAYHLDDLISEEFGRKQVELRKAAEEKLKVVLMENLNDQL